MFSISRISILCFLVPEFPFDSNSDQEGCLTVIFAER
jgi:hypothetical protein